jgi:hypothetical protein
MLARAVLTIHRALLLLALAVALTATGFAHRIATDTDAAESSALAFAFANGAGASDFCGGLPGSDRTGSLHCPSCQIAGSADLPSMVGKLITLKLAIHTQVIAPRKIILRRSILDPAHTPQGPPVA